MTDEEITLLGESGLTGAGFSEGEKAVIRFALETTKDVAASNDAHAELQKAFPLNQVVEIAFVVATANFIQRIGKTSTSNWSDQKPNARHSENAQEMVSGTTFSLEALTTPAYATDRDVCPSH